MSYTVSVEPASEPITSSDLVTGGLHVTDTEQLAYIDLMITGIRKWIERTYDMAIFTQTILEKYDYWPCISSMDLTVTPLGAVSSVKYYNEDGVLTTLASSTYWERVDTLTGQIWLRDGESWPAIQVGRPHAIEVTYTAGWATVPEHVKQWFKSIVAATYLTESEGDGEITETFETSGTFQQLVDKIPFIYPELKIMV